ncbi:MAG TPA: ABC transporter substrate-binding protein [Albitalea sp.]
MNFAVAGPRPKVRPPGWIRSAALCATALFSAAACAFDPGVTEREIVIGQTLSLQGGKNDYAVSAAQGMKLYFDAVNAAGGVNGRRIVQRILDDDSHSAQAEANARKLVQEGVFVLFGPIDGGPTAAVMKVAAELQVPLFGPLAGPPTLRRPHQPYVFPVRAEHRDEFRALLGWTKETGYRTVGLLHADTEVGRQHLENVRQIALSLGLEVVLPLPFKGDAGEADIERMVSTMVAKAPHVMLNHGSASLYEKLIAKAKAAGVKTIFMGVNSGSYQIAKGLGPLAEGMVFSQVVPSPWERKREIVREYQDTARKGRELHEFNYGSLEGFMTAKALVEGLRAAGREPTRAGFVKALEGMKIDLGGVPLRYAPGQHEGSTFVDLSIVTRQGRFMH